jgi:Ca2+-binding EF-hand superfamily protein
MAFAMLNRPFDSSDVESLMTEADRDRDGRISFDEFLSSKKSQVFYNLNLNV